MKKSFFWITVFAVTWNSQIVLASDKATKKGKKILNGYVGLFCGKKAIDDTVATLQKTYKKLCPMITSNPDAIREIYLACQHADFEFSEATAELLQKAGFLDKDHTPTADCINHFKKFITHDELTGTKDDFDLTQCIRDLISKHPTVIEGFETAFKEKRTIISDISKVLLHKQYGLLKSASEITDDEFYRIALAIQTEKLHSASHNTSSKTRVRRRSILNFKIKSLDEVVSELDNTVS